MFCRNCGDEISDNSKFCPKCGEALKGISKTVAGESTNNKEKVLKEVGCLVKIFKWLLIGFIVITGLVILGYTLLIFLNIIYTMNVL